MEDFAVSVPLQMLVLTRCEKHPAEDSTALCVYQDNQWSVMYCTVLKEKNLLVPSLKH